MADRLASPRQRALLDAIVASGPLILACGPEGVSVNLVGRFRLVRHGDEDRFDLGDGTHHVHVDWHRVTKAEFGEFEGEGMVTFRDGDRVLFKLYRSAGPFPMQVQALGGALEPT